jgi:fido (protein-threonine AMPylation protein)
VTALDPGYGETPLVPDEADALTDSARESLGDDPSRADVYDAEQAISNEVSIALFTDVVDGRLAVPDLLTDTFVRELHYQLYADIWTWAGRYRLTEKSVGIDPSLISVELRSSLQTIAYRWEHTDDWTARQLGIAVHADAVRIHPFVDGNGRSTRLLANLVFVAAQDSDESLLIYDWDVEKRPYVDLLRTYDRTRDPAALSAFIPVTVVS